MIDALGFAVLQEESRVVIVRFGHDWDQACMQMDEVLLEAPLCASHKCQNSSKCPTALLL